MKAIQLEGSRVKALKQEIFESISNTKLAKISNLLKITRSRGKSYSSHPSYFRPSTDSLNFKTELSPQRISFSPPSYLHSLSAVNDSVGPVGHKLERELFKIGTKKHSRSKRSRKEGHNLIQRQMDSRKKGGKSISHGKDKKSGKNKSKSRSKNKEKQSSKLNLSSIIEQESAESKLITPSSKPERSRYRQGRKLSGDRTKKKSRRGLSEVVWRRLQRTLRDPERFIRILKNDFLNVRFRVLRNTLLEIQINAGKQLHNLSIVLHKGNLECQGIQEMFPILEPNSSFSLYSAVRALDLNDPLRLPQIQIQASLNEDEKIYKLVTLPYCWLHMAEQSTLKQQRSRIKTKACLQGMECTKMGLKGLMGILPGWGCQSIGRGTSVWQSRVSFGSDDFQIRVVEREGQFVGEISGRGQQRLIRMLQFLQQLLV